MKRPILAALLFACLGTAAMAQQTVPLRVLAINDFHGALKAGGKLTLADPAKPGETISVPAGGAEYMASLVRAKRSEVTNSIFVAAGDLVGATPLLSALFDDEPTIMALSMMGLEVSAVGNHEFDRGAEELLRKQNGGCRVTGCTSPRPFYGAGYRYLAASTIDKASGKPLFPPYFVKEVEGVKMAFIGLTLKGTPDIVVPSGVAGLEFRDEAETVNALVPELKAKGINAIAVLIHEGGFPAGSYNECTGISGPIVNIVKKLDPAVKLVISGHTHKAYLCQIDGKLVTSGDKYGTIVTTIDLTLDKASGTIREAKADNLIVRSDVLPKDAEQSALIADFEKVAAPLENRVVGHITQALSRDNSETGESLLGAVIADSQLEMTKAKETGGAQIAFMNDGGLRSSLPRTRDDGAVTYGQIFAVQPFSNNLVTLSLRGAQIHKLLEQQWLDQPKPRVLHVSNGFSYTYDLSKPTGARVDPSSITLDGKGIDPQALYRVTVNGFLAEGGDGFRVLKEGTDRLTGIMDVDGFETYLSAHNPVSPPKLGRIVKSGP
jgi:5'-nucleotidase